MDGTLVDTEPYWIAAEYRLVESFGGSWSDEHAHAVIGKPLLVSATYIREHGGVPLSPSRSLTGCWPPLSPTPGGRSTGGPARWRCWLR